MTSTSASYPTAVRHREWYRLDNAGKLYPAITTSKWNSVFRVSIILRSEINPQTLQELIISPFILQTQLLQDCLVHWKEPQASTHSGRRGGLVVFLGKKEYAFVAVSSWATDLYRFSMPLRMVPVRWFS